MVDAGVGQRGPEQAAAVANSVVGQDPGHGDAVQSEPVQPVVPRVGRRRAAGTQQPVSVTTGEPAQRRPTGRPIRRYEHPQPGDLVRLDTKKLGRRPSGGGHRVHGRAAGAVNRRADRSGVHIPSPPPPQAAGQSVAGTTSAALTSAASGRGGRAGDLRLSCRRSSAVPALAGCVQAKPARPLEPPGSPRGPETTSCNP